MSITRRYTTLAQPSTPWCHPCHLSNVFYSVLSVFRCEWLHFHSQSLISNMWYLNSLSRSRNLLGKYYLTDFVISLWWKGSKGVCLDSSKCWVFLVEITIVFVLIPFIVFPFIAFLRIRISTDRTDINRGWGGGGTLKTPGSNVTRKRSLGQTQFWVNDDPRNRSTCPGIQTMQNWVNLTSLYVKSAESLPNSGSLSTQQRHPQIFTMYFSVLNLNNNKCKW